MGFICKAGAYSSSGGRKIKILTLRPDMRYTVGIEISKTHIRQALPDLSWRIADTAQIRRAYENAKACYGGLEDEPNAFLLKKSGDGRPSGRHGAVRLRLRRQ